ncbi:MAG: DUF4149 domain-containing protein [Gammaproteobacteria bacterium]
MLAARARLLVIVLWVGSLWTVGYLVAPTLFATLSDRVLAGTIAGAMFRSQAWLSLVCGVAMVGLVTASPDLDAARRRQLRTISLAMLACLGIGYFGLQPMMAQLKAGAVATGGVMDEAARARFGMLHGVSSVFYLVQSLLGGVLLFKNR